MNTIEELKSGALKGATHIKLACGLTEFPLELLDLADTLEVLDMTDNKLSALPENFSNFKKLKILFLSNNNFTELPTVLAKCPKLSTIGFRNNQIETVAQNAIPSSTRWLILTDNHIKTLPDSMGDLPLLQKCMLSGNKLTSLPQSMSKCHNLELLRIAVNKLTTLPAFLLSLPKLSWLAYSGNPFCSKHPNCDVPLKELAWETLEIKEVLGEGASGLISKAIYDGKEVAIKVFKGEITSDGLPEEEMDINISMGHHDHLVDVLARVTGHPEGKDVLMLELIPPHFFNLGLPPMLETCSRDVYPEGFTLSLSHVLKILQGMADATTHMHARGIMHGDFYAHNIMIDAQANSILGDFGGASFFEPSEVEIRNGLERLEVRAFGYLVEELLKLSSQDSSNNHIKEILRILQNRCMHEVNQNRPLFSEIKEILAI
ncbi:MAG: serine/threonine-protein kinase [Epsilonproteobacteria bacterium]|nr:serine/threonine-protein kinase [Campylobacterota bacterium]